MAATTASEHVHPNALVLHLNPATTFANLGTTAYQTSPGR